MKRESNTIGPTELLTSREAAEYLKISRATLQRLSRAGEIPAIRIGKLWRYRKSDLDAWADSQVSFPAPSVPR